MADFFISYTRADKDWARWIARVLEEAGCKVIFQERDFRPGGNFVAEMDEALLKAQTVVAVLSPEYFKSPYTKVEWTAALASTLADNKRRRLVPVRVRKVDPDGLLSTITYVDLVNTDRGEARRRLLETLAPKEKQSAETASSLWRLTRSLLFPPFLSLIRRIAAAALLAAVAIAAYFWLRDPIEPPIITKVTATREGGQVTGVVFFEVPEVPEEGSVFLQVGGDAGLDELCFPEAPVGHPEQGSAIWGCALYEQQGYARLVIREEDNSKVSQSKIERFSIEEIKP